MAKPSQVIVLVEDDRQKQLVFRYLRRIGLDTHDMRFESTASGSGEQWVRERFPFEVSAYRRRSANVQTRLIAVIDADVLTLQARLTQLDQKLREHRLEPIGTDENVARLVPRRNIETWILCLNAETVDEEIDYKRSRNDWTELIRPAADNLYAWTRPNAQLPNECIPSLTHGVTELQRLDFSGV